MTDALRQPLRVWELLDALLEGGVEFLVVGGIAVGAHGFERATKDLDIVPSPARSNLDRLYEVLTSLAAQPVELADFAPEELPLKLSPAALAEGGNWFLTTRFGRLDLMQHLEGVVEAPADYAELLDRAMTVETPVGAVRFAGYEDLLRMKLAAGRDLDLVDVRALREARGELE
jgi:hypothetical protein